MSYYIQQGELYNYGVLGMQWGVRRFQNIDGSLTEAGKDHRAKYIAREQPRPVKQSKFSKQIQSDAKRYNNIKISSEC